MKKRILALLCALSVLLTFCVVGIAEEADNTVSLNEGLLFGKNDTYLQLSAPLTATPNTMAASIKMDPLLSEWTVASGDETETMFSGGEFGVSTGEGTGADINTLPAGTAYAKTEIAATLAKTLSIVVPKYYEKEDLKLTFWMYLESAAGFNGGQIELNSSGKVDSQEMYFNVKSLAQSGTLTLKDGWNYVELPFEYGLPGSEEEFDWRNIRYIRWHGKKTSASKTGFALADMKIVGSEKTVVSNPDAVDTGVQNHMIFSNTNSTDESPVALLVTPDGKPSLIWGSKQYTVDQNVCTGEWVDITVVRDTAQQKIFFYINGEQVAAFSADGTEDIVPVTAHCIAADGAGIHGGRLYGQLADVRVWSDARTAAEIRQSYKAKYEDGESGLDTADEHLIGAWALAGELQHVLKTLPDDSRYQNELIYCGSRADDWSDYTLPEEIGEDGYSIVIIPDIQNMTGSHASSSRLNAWLAAAEWIADNVEEQNIVHVLGAGDLTALAADKEYFRAQYGYEMFWNKVSWSAMIGNHDYPGVSSSTITKRDTTAYQKYFGLQYVQSTKAAETFGGYFEDPYGISTTENAYFTFGVNGVKWMILQLEYLPRLHVMGWAKRILEQYSDYNVILATHAYIGGTWANYQPNIMAYTTEDDKNGGYLGDSTQPIWDELAYKYTNIKMVWCGHARTIDGSVLLSEKENRVGVSVPQLMLNAQDMDSTYFSDMALGTLGIFHFSADGTKVDLQYYSPYHGKTFNPNGKELMLTLDVQVDENCPHEESKEKPVRSATCKRAGLKQTCCTECGHVFDSEELPKLTEHSFDRGVNDPQDFSSVVYTCSVCDETRTVQMGDVDEDGKITSTDARLVLQYFVGAIDREDLTFRVADVDNSGKVDSTDARLILQYFVGTIQEFPTV